VLIIALTIAQSGNGQTLKKLQTYAYDWNKLEITKTKSGERRQIFEGSTNELTYFEVHATTLNPGKAPHGSHVHSDMEELIIVKEGTVEQSINGKKKTLGPGSAILALPGDDHGIWNVGDTKATYYIIRWRTGDSVNSKRAAESGGSKFYDWNEVEFKTTKKGGKRQFMQRPTALLSELEMHVTTLSEGVTSHGEHVHDAEEIILVIKGYVEESIAGEKHKLGPGSLILLMDDVPHGIRNAGDGPCEYFAFKWVK
jgi:quercetin dioxygenase-like cupin family protein